MADMEEPLAGPRLRQKLLMQAAEDMGLLGAKDRQVGGRFPAALLEQAKRASGLTETTELLTYALVQVALEDDYAERLIALKGSVPKGVLFAG